MVCYWIWKKFRNLTQSRRSARERMRWRRVVIVLLFFATPFLSFSTVPSGEKRENGSASTKKRELIELKSGPDDLVWVVQLSDLHFSVHHPDRALDFRKFIGPILSVINPSLVLLTGDLTDGKSKDLLTMKQDEEEWIEYQKVMDNVVESSGLNKNIFYDVRGNHDNFGVPVLGGFYDFFSKYSFNGRLQRSSNVNSITIQTSQRKILFVGFDSTTDSGLRGPSNLFGHPTDELLSDISSELSQWDSQSTQPVIKVSFGHFPLTFSAATKSGKTLQDVFLMNSLSAYLCGHLHKKFGKNLKRHHLLHHHHHQIPFKQLFQFNGHQSIPSGSSNCFNNGEEINQFWEWEMGDWRQSRAMRILAIDSGHLSFVDLNFELGAKNTIILPTFPLDSRFTSKSFQCGKTNTSYGEIRALVFSVSPITSVMARIYDSRSGNLHAVMETSMRKWEKSHDLFVAPWYLKNFEDPSPERYLLQIEAIDIHGTSTLSELRPFSISGIGAKLPWTWIEFFVMGCQWDLLYFPILCFFYLLVFSIILIPKILSFSRKRNTPDNLKSSHKSKARIFLELQTVPSVWLSMIGYLFYLLLCPWFSGQVFTQVGEMGYMTYRGWVLSSKDDGKLDFKGFPDVMVVVLPHLYFVVLPAFITIIAFAAEKGIHRFYIFSLFSKKKDDLDFAMQNQVYNLLLPKRWLRKFLLLVSLAICWKHLMNCRFLMKAYEINSIFQFPFYSLVVPLLLAYNG